jgi:hypothetical protein
VTENGTVVVVDVGAVVVVLLAGAVVVELDDAAVVVVELAPALALPQAASVNPAAATATTTVPERRNPL